MSKVLCLPADNLLHCVKHDDGDRRVWVFLVDEANNASGCLEWVLTDEKPTKAGVKPDMRYVGGRLYVEVKVKELFTDAGEMLSAEREQGFNSWRGVCQSPSSYEFRYL